VIKEQGLSTVGTREPAIAMLRSPVCKDANA
jgi:hypothetical protein